jgi:fructokinase
VKPDNGDSNNLYLHFKPNGSASRSRVLVLGEVLWDLFPASVRLGGAALNFAAHIKRLGHEPVLISAVGTDELGDQAIHAITTLGLDLSFLQKTERFKTGTAAVQLGPGDQTSFVIERPAAYDAVQLSDGDIEQIIKWKPEWLYYGTLFSSSVTGKDVLRRLLEALPQAKRFYDLNLRPGSDSPELVSELLRAANVIKLNEEELRSVHEFTQLPPETEAFCRAGAERFGWDAVCITLGARGCAMLAGEEYVEVNGHRVDVADTVGAGDAFAAAFMHGIVSNRPASEIAEFSNRVGALVASVHGAIPNWTIEEVVDL